MRTIRKPLLAVLVAAMALVSVSGPARGDDSGSLNGPDARSAPSGDVSSAMQIAEDLVMLVVGENLDVFSGAGYWGDYSQLEVFAVADEMDRASSLLIASGADPQRWKLTPRLHSYNALVNQAARLAEEFSASGYPAMAVGPAPDASGVQATFSSQEDAVKATGQRAGRATASRLTSVNDSAAANLQIVVEESQGFSVQSAVSDALRFTMGSSLIGSAGASMVCSAGYPIILPNGTRGVLTAGHCGFGTFSNPGAGSPYIVGATYANVFPARARTRGDWQVISNNGAVANPNNWPVIGSHPDRVERFVYTARNPNTGTESEKRLIEGMNYTIRPINSQLCVSGAASGNTCRYRVKTTGDTIDIGEFGTVSLVGHVTTYYSDQDWNGVADCGYPVGGDSGGAVYYNGGNGQLVGYGIQTAAQPDPSCPMSGSFRRAKLFAMTQMSGVKADHPDAIVGGFLNATP